MKSTRIVQKFSDGDKSVYQVVIVGKSKTYVSYFHKTPSKLSQGDTVRLSAIRVTPTAFQVLCAMANRHE